MSILASGIYMVFYGLAYSIQDLGLELINYNGIFFGITQSAGYLSILPFAYKMPRKRWMIIFQILILLGASILFFLSIIPETDTVRLMETIVSTCILAAVNSCQFVFLYTYVSELFPIKIRGLANALVLFTGKMIGSTSPFFTSMSKGYGVHILIGCSLITLISLPLTFFLDETLVLPGDKDKKVDSEGPDSDYQTMNISESTQDDLTLRCEAFAKGT